MSKPIYACLWFENQASEAAQYYCSIFKDSKLAQDTPMVATFELNGTRFMALNGGREQFKFNESVSFVVECETQEDIDHYWGSLTANGGEESMCGWLKDKYGVSWQIIPAILPKLMGDPEKGPRVVQAFLKMRKFNIQELLDA